MSSCVLFILDCMSSVSIAELNNVLMFSFQCVKEKVIPELGVFPFCCLDLYGIFIKQDRK